MSFLWYLYDCVRHKKEPKQVVAREAIRLLATYKNLNRGPSMCGASASAHCLPPWQGFITWHRHRRAMKRGTVSIADREQLLIVRMTSSWSHVGISITLWRGRRRGGVEHNSSWLWPLQQIMMQQWKCPAFRNEMHKQMLDRKKCEKSADTMKGPTVA